ncbi:zinc ribbon domain-containing protein [Tenacibaculum jejuense]|uniref:Uncharacterized protein n=1 Tax=Tenacibaculum jejuense TaxID=584609 RepID=A0A238UE06_9FLAO|nr:zinc-ribbon domain-containing protein [Tenacibaculum jejuense]SNR17419.1 protein of unknown function [Tenacibaculum jejuense]
MFFILFGTRSSKLKEKEIRVNCSACNQTTRHRLIGMAKYFHIFWIPFFPLAKRTQIICSSCTTINKDATKLRVTQNLKRPLWHFSGLFLIGLLIIAHSLLSYIDMYNYSQEKKAFKEEFKIIDKKNDSLKNVFYSDLKKLSFSPEKNIDSISSNIKENFYFKEFGLDNKQVSLFSKIKKQKLLVLLNIQEKSEPDIYLTIKNMLIIKELENFIINNYHSRINDIFIGIYKNEELKMSHNQSLKFFTKRDKENLLLQFYFNPEDNNYPYLDFLYNQTPEENKDYNYISKLKTLNNYKKLKRKKVKNDPKKVEKLWNQILKKYNFEYIEKARPVTYKDNYKFLKRTNNLIPESLELLLLHNNTNGPFLKYHEIMNNSWKIMDKFSNNNYDNLKTKDTLKNKRKVIPIKASPFWVLFYEDNKYRYFIDLLPDKYGFTEQIIMVDNNDNVSFVASNLESFLVLYKEKKVPVDLYGWVK